MKSVLFASTCLFASVASSVFSADSQIKTVKEQDGDQNKLKCPILLYDSFDNRGVNLGVRGDFLYMTYNSPVLTYASEQTTVDRTLNSTILNVPGKTTWGWDIAVMYTLPHQPGYTLEFEWFHIKPTFSRQDTANNLLPAHSVALTQTATGTGQVHAHININFFDFVFKKRFSLGGWTEVTPTAGVIGGYMSGESDSHFQATSGAFSRVAGVTTVATTIADLDYTTDFKGIGLRLGGNVAFKLWDGLKLTGDLFYNVLYGPAKAHLTYSQNGIFNDLNATDVHYSQHNCRPFFDSLLALAWGRSFDDNSMFFDVHAGWRFQTFSDGWKEFEAEFDDSLHELSLQGQGLQGGVTFKF